MNFIFRIFLTFNATSLILVVYLVKEKFLISNLNQYFVRFPDFISYIIYIAIPLITTLFSLYLSRYLDFDSIELEDGTAVIKEIEQANNSFLPSYLGYFFVALSVQDCDTLIFVFIILFVFTFLSQTLYFNPIFLIFGYNFYYVTTNTHIKILLITKRTLKNPNMLSFPKIQRINDFTFIENRRY